MSQRADPEAGCFWTILGVVAIMAIVLILISLGIEP